MRTNPEHDENPVSKIRAFLRFPLTWLITGSAGVILVDLLLRPWADHVGGLLSVPLALLEGGLALVVYTLTMRYLPRRPLPELTGTHALRETVLGCSLGLVFLLTSALVILALGGYSLRWADADLNSVFGRAISAALEGAVIEELVFRGLLLQAIERWLGRWVALAVTSAFFGIAHLANHGATWWSALAISIEAGFLLGTAFLWRRNLWFVMGLHFSWNALEEILGIPVSGHHLGSGIFLIESRGPDLLTGGAFGLEGSVITVIISLLITVPMLIQAMRRRPGYSQIESKP